MNNQLYRNQLLSNLVLEGMPLDLLKEVSTEITTDELEHLLRLMKASNQVKNGASHQCRP